MLVQGQKLQFQGQKVAKVSIPERFSIPELIDKIPLNFQNWLRKAEKTRASTLYS